MTEPNLSKNFIKTPKATEEKQLSQQQDEQNLENQLSDMPLTQHLIELRQHFIRMLVAVLVIFLALVGFSREIYDLFLRRWSPYCQAMLA